MIWFGRSTLGSLRMWSASRLSGTWPGLSPITTVVTGTPYATRSCFFTSLASSCRTRPGSPSPISTSPPGPSVRWTASRLRFAAITGLDTHCFGSICSATSADPAWPAYRL